MERGSTTLLLIYAIIAVGVGTAFALIAPPETVQLWLLPLLATIIVIGVALLVLHIISHHQRLRRKLRKMAALIVVEPTETLKNLYLEIYHLYLSVSHRHQKRYYPVVLGIRKRLEEGMQTEKRMEYLFEEVQKKSLSAAIKMYEEIQVLFRKLPQKSQGKYYAKLIHLRQKLEVGK